MRAHGTAAFLRGNQVRKCQVTVLYFEVGEIAYADVRDVVRIALFHH